MAFVIDLQDWENRFIDFFSKDHDQSDASHDLSHFQRVYHTSKTIASLDETSVDSMVLLAAAYFHDPLVLNRALNSHQFAMDRVIEARPEFPQFIDGFLSQFKEEVVLS